MQQLSSVLSVCVLDFHLRQTSRKLPGTGDNHSSYGMELLVCSHPVFLIPQTKQLIPTGIQFWFDSLHERFAHLFPASGSLCLHSRGKDTEHRDGITQTLPAPGEVRKKHFRIWTHITGIYVQREPKMFPPTVVFWGLKGYNSIIRFNDPGTSCLSDWVGIKLRGQTKCPCGEKPGCDVNLCLWDRDRSLCSPAWVKAENYITFLLSCHLWPGFSLK